MCIRDSFGAVHEATGGGFPQDTVDALWSLVWRGLITNDTLHALRAYVAGSERGRRAPRPHRFRSRRLLPPSAEGRWSLIETPGADNPTARAAALTRQMLAYAGRASLRRDVIDIRDVLIDIVALVRAAQPKKVAFITEPMLEPLWVERL